MEKRPVATHIETLSKDFRAQRVGKDSIEKSKKIRNVSEPTTDWIAYCGKAPQAPLVKTYLSYFELEGFIRQGEEECIKAGFTTKSGDNLLVKILKKIKESQFTPEEKAAAFEIVLSENGTGGSTKGQLLKSFYDSTIGSDPEKLHVYALIRYVFPNGAVVMTNIDWVILDAIGESTCLAADTRAVINSKLQTIGMDLLVDAK
jgi:hypothetical protein